MRLLAITLVAAGSLAVMALGGGAIAADRAPRARHSVAAESTTVVGASAAATRLWYGGTLAPIQVQATAPAGKAAPKADCPARN
ncbi:MAG TPA: hypothetical protein VKB45_18280 [Gemmatimonadales bacterium]|nr:hypothetical protein [Gemmatimonadales bacterium]